MNVTRLFILRPVTTLLLSFSILVLGAIAWRFLPVAPLPQADFPVIVVSASVPGASPESMAATVASPLERSLGTIAGVTQLTSRSSQGSSSVIMVFDIGTDVDSAARDVQAAINASRSLLPAAMPSLPSYRKVDPSAAPILMLALSSPTRSKQDIYDLAASELTPLIAQIKGVGDVSLFGGSLPAIRIELEPDKLAHAAVSLEQVRQTVNRATGIHPKGQLQGKRTRWLIDGNGQLTDLEDYRQLVVSRGDNGEVRLGDVAKVSSSVEDIYNVGYYNGTPSVVMSVTQAADANMLATIDAIKNRLPQLRKDLPSDVSLTLALDQSANIRDTLNATQETLLIAVLLVILVVFLFLRSGRATAIPAAVLPISLIGSFAVMYLLGFSINNMTLMALIIATGFVVDDAIVVLENITRLLEAGVPPMQAALRGAREVAFTVISMTLTLIAVFIPLLFMGGVLGQFFREFALTLSVALLISLMVSLSLTPMLCSRLLTASTAEAGSGNRLLLALAKVMTWLESSYARALAIVMRHKRLTMLSLLLTIIFNGYLYVHIDKDFFPQQDTGMLYGSIRGDNTSSFAATHEELLKIADQIRHAPGVASVLASVGGGRWGSRNRGRLYIRLDDINQRRLTSSEIANQLTKRYRDEPGYRVYLRPASHMHMGGRSADASYQFSFQADDLALLSNWIGLAEDAFKALPELTSVNSDAGNRDSQVLNLEIDRDAASRLGLNASNIDSLLGNAFSQRQIATIYRTLNQYHVVMGLSERYLDNPAALDKLYLINQQGKQIPISAVARVKPGTTPSSVSHQDQMATNTISFNLADGISLEQAQFAIDDALVRIGLPRSIKASFQGDAQMFSDFVNHMPWLLLAALLTVYAVLGILYESYAHPLTILSTLPSAGVGALLLLGWLGFPLSVMALIGILLLIGIVKKNAIMMVDFALAAERDRGLSAEAAIMEACRVRFRPILMTTLAAFFGALPLAIGTGADPSLRQPLGITIMGGLAVSQLLTLFTTPVVYLYLDQLGTKMHHVWQRLLPSSLEVKKLP